MSFVILSENFRSLIMSAALHEPVASAVSAKRVEIRKVPIRTRWQASNQVYVSAIRLLGTIDTSLTPYINIRIVKLNDVTLIVNDPMPAQVTIDGDDCVARLTEADVAISGTTCTEAISALRDFIGHLYYKARAGVKAGPAMMSIFQYLESHIVYGPQQHFTERS